MSDKTIQLSAVPTDQYDGTILAIFSLSTKKQKNHVYLQFMLDLWVHSKQQPVQSFCTILKNYEKKKKIQEVVPLPVVIITNYNSNI